MSNELSHLPPKLSDECDAPASYLVEIRGGRTGFRRCPILGDRFLIGSDPVCDLRVDDRIAAPLHCLLRRDGSRLEAESLAGTRIVVNGVPVEHAVVGDGETLTIGALQLTVHAHAMRFDVVRSPDADEAPAFAGVVDSTAATVECRTAAEVVDLLELEQDRLQNFDDRRRAGASALLDVVRQTRRPAEAAMALAGPQPEEMIARLRRLTASIERQSLTPIDDAADLQQAAAQLLAAQRTLLGQADRLLRLTAAMVDAHRARSSRAA